MTEYIAHKCDADDCNSRETSQYWYTPDDSTFLCMEHAKGLFCLYCGNFTGGTEDVFRYGYYACSECHSIQEYEIRDYDDDYYNDEDD